jgi:hypothetical protein
MSQSVHQKNCCYPFLGFHIKNEKIQKKNIFRRNQKIIEARKGCWNAEKR